MAALDAAENKINYDRPRVKRAQAGWKCSKSRAGLSQDATGR
jgi:hypothetical protein